MKEYIYDGSFEGLLTALFYAYPHPNESQITSDVHYTPNLLYEPISITIEPDKVNRITSSIQTRLSTTILETIYYLYLSDVDGVEQLILRYLRLCYTYGPSINLAKNNDTIIEVDTLRRKVTHESHRFTGFVRFKEVAPLYFYATISPDHHILPLIANHFTRRFSDQHFIIHDTKRQIALVYDLKDCYLRTLTPDEHTALCHAKTYDHFEALFKTFYTSVTITARHNPKLQKRLVPTRYWKNLPELSTP